MTKFYDKYLVHQILIQPVKLFGQPKEDAVKHVLDSDVPKIRKTANKGLISSNAFRQLQFVIETRR